MQKNMIKHFYKVVLLLNFMHTCTFNLALIRIDFDIYLTIVYICILLFMFTVMNFFLFT